MASGLNLKGTAGYTYIHVSIYSINHTYGESWPASKRAMELSKLENGEATDVYVKR